MLYIVSTPIGHLKDITLRALETLAEADLIAAEDTRHSRILLSHYQISTPVTSYFEHNKLKKGESLLRRLQAGKKIALVTDAGTPGISDPGYHLIRLALENEVPMTVVPGACALVAALTLSGLPCHSFVFEGFLPVKSAARRKKLESLREDPRTIIFYESPHRLVKTLGDIAEIMDNRTVVCAREITKKFEEVKRGPSRELQAFFTKARPKGEIVLLIGGPGT